MIISHPEAKAQYGTICSGITELIDLYPTLSELCGLSDQQPGILQGKSLAKVILEGNRPESGKVAYTTAKGGNASTIRTERWRYTRWGEDPLTFNEQLYDHQNDPEEQTNLVLDPGYRKVLTELRSLYEQTRKTARRGLEKTGG
jgi:arylsulfatase A-like enzyme